MSCVTDSDCPNASECSLGTCVCNSLVSIISFEVTCTTECNTTENCDGTMVCVNSNCVDPVNDLGSCSVDSECENNFSCDAQNGICYCSGDVIEQDGEYVCPLTQVNGPCTIDEQCPGVATCFTDVGVCRCLHDLTVNSDGTWTCSKPCTLDSDCTTFNAASVCENGLCVDSDDPINTIPPFTTPTYPSVCLDDQDCPNAYTCHNATGSCICLHALVWQDSSWFCDQTCFEDMDCADHMVCNNGSCIEQVISSGICETDGDCDMDLVCDVPSGICVCASEIVWQGNSWVCKNESDVLEGPCLIDEHCPGVATCDASVGVCHCLHDIVTIAGSWMCETDCTTDSQCATLNPSSVCMNGKCTDSDDPINVRPPFTTPVLPSVCATDDDCFGVMQCHVSSGTCICLDELEWSGSEWLCTRECTEDENCDDDTVCNNGTCVPQITSSGLCESDKDCSGALICNTQSGLCECLSEVVWMDGSYTCPDNTTQIPNLQQPCQIDEQCPGVATCFEEVGVCECLHELIQSTEGNWMCTKPCLEDLECSIFNPAAICENGQCTDSDDPINTIPPFTTPTYPENCTNDNDCEGSYTCHVESETCICSHTLQWIDGDWKCQENCIEDHDCASVSMVCNQGICVDQVISSGICETDSDCSESLVCDLASGICICPTDLIWIGSDWSCGSPTPVEGPCLIDEHCPGVAVCDTNVGICHCLHEIVTVNGEWMCQTDCLADSDCILLNPASICTAGQCTDSNDPINTRPPFTTEVLPDICSDDNDCYGVNTCHVASGSCICLDQLEWVDDQWSCIRSCNEDIECDDDTVCNDGSCVPQKTSSGLCELDSDCSNGLVCNIASGLCECLDAVIWLNGAWSCPSLSTTMTPVTLIGPCTIDEQCPGVATCYAEVGVCRCLHDLNVLPDGGWTCTTVCSTSDECTTLNPASVCENNKCVDSNDPINTIPPFTTAARPENCSTDSECFGSYTCDIVSSSCVCQHMTVIIDGEEHCHQSCTTDSDCPSSMVCNENICIEQIISSGVCEVDSDCDQNLICDEISGICICETTVNWSDGEWTCPPEPTSLGPCLIDEHCPGVAVCDSSNGICTCLHDIVIDNSAWTCTKDCLTDIDCTIFNPLAVCEEGSCVDSDDPLNTRPPFTTPKLPDICIDDEDCYGVTQCHSQSGQCICLY